MPTHLDITILPGGGSLAGRRMVINQAPARIGRDLSNTIVLDTPLISRVHAELNYQTDENHPNGHWLITNFSQNGLSIGRKKISQDAFAINKPITLRCGKQDILSITPILVADETTTPNANANIQTSQPSQTAILEGFDPGSTQPLHTNQTASTDKRRMLIWSGVGAWVLFLCVVGAVLSFLPDKKNKQSGQLPPQLTAHAIEAELLTPPQTTNRNPTLAQLELAEATRHFQDIDRQRDALSRAYQHYITALQHTPDGVFENGLDQRRFQHTQAALTQALTQTYQDAYALAQNREFTRALDRLDDLSKLYAAATADSQLMQNVQRLKQHCRN